MDSELLPPAPSLRILGGEFIQGRGGGEGRVGIGGIVLFLFRGFGERGVQGKEG